MIPQFYMCYSWRMTAVCVLASAYTTYWLPLARLEDELPGWGSASAKECRRSVHICSAFHVPRSCHSPPWRQQWIRSAALLLILCCTGCGLEALCGLRRRLWRFRYDMN